MGAWLSLLCGLFIDYPGSGPRQAALLLSWSAALAAGLWWERRELRRSGLAVKKSYWSLRYLIAAAAGAAGVSVVYLRSLQSHMGPLGVATILAFLILVAAGGMALAAREELKRSKAAAPSYRRLFELSLRQDGPLALLALAIVLSGRASPPQKPPSLVEKEDYLMIPPIWDGE